MHKQNRNESENGRVLKAAGIMGAATFLSRIMGLVREQVFAVLFGAGNATDAFNVAFRIPNLLRDLFAEGAMSAALVPTFTRVKTEEGELRAWRLAGLVFRVLLVVVGLITAVGIFFAPQLVSLYASSFSHIPGKFELTVQMTRIMFPFFPLVALAAVFMAVLNALGVFFIPAFAPALFNVVSIVSGVLFSLWVPRWGWHPMSGMAIGVVLGGAIQAFCQLPSLYRAGYSWSKVQSAAIEKPWPTWSEDPGLRRIFKLMIPGLLGLAATQVNVLVNTILATSQGPGAVSWLNYAFRLMQFPIGVFGVSLAAATLPVVSKQWVDKKPEAVAATLKNSICQVFAVNLPASAMFIFLGAPIIQLLFEYGRFFHTDTLATAHALAAYAIGLTAYSAVKVLVPACYALGDTRIPVISSVLSVVLTIVLNLILVHPLGYVGLACGTSVAAFFNFSFLLLSLRRLLRQAGSDISVRSIVLSFLRHLGLALVLGIVGVAVWQGISLMMSDADWLRSGEGYRRTLALIRLARVIAAASVGVVIWYGIARWLRVFDVTDTVAFFVRKIEARVPLRWRARVSHGLNRYFY